MPRRPAASEALNEGGPRFELRTRSASASLVVPEPEPSSCSRPGRPDLGERDLSAKYVLTLLERNTGAGEQALEPARVVAQEPMQKPGRIAADEREVTGNRDLADTDYAVRSKLAHT